MTDGVWWFFLILDAILPEIPSSVSKHLKAWVWLWSLRLYAITMFSIYGGKPPSIAVRKTGQNPYAARMKVTFIFGFIPLLVLLAQPLGTTSVAGSNYWLQRRCTPIMVRQYFSTVGDMFCVIGYYYVRRYGRGLKCTDLTKNRLEGCLCWWIEPSLYDRKPVDISQYLFCRSRILIGWIVLFRSSNISRWKIYKKKV